MGARSTLPLIMGFASSIRQKRPHRVFIAHCLWNNFKLTTTGQLFVKPLFQ